MAERKLKGQEESAREVLNPNEGDHPAEDRLLEEAGPTPRAMPKGGNQRDHQFFMEDPAGNFIATPEGRLIECNAAFAEIYRLPPPH